MCDFLIEDRAAPDFDYIFIEIEPAKTELFYKSKKEERKFRAKVHRGLSQLRDCKIWIRENIHIFKKDFPAFD